MKSKITKHSIKKNVKDELEIFLSMHVLPVYNLAQEGGLGLLLRPPGYAYDYDGALTIYFGDYHTPCTYNTTRDRYYQEYLLITWRKAIFPDPIPIPLFFLWQSKHSSISFSSFTLICVYM